MSSPSFAGEFLHHPDPPVYPAIAPPSFPCRPGSSIQIDCRSEGSSTITCVCRGKGSSNGARYRLTIDMLPDVALLEIFDCYMNQAREEKDWPPTKIEAWHTLVHVCRTWRAIILGSPHRLDLQLLCTNGTPVKERLAIWPPLPIIVAQVNSPTQMDNFIAALEHNDRVCQIHLMNVINPKLEEFLAAMHQPFPVLTDLRLWYEEKWVKDEMIEKPDIPESFLGGFAPRLQRLWLQFIPFSRLPKLLLSATDLVALTIWKIPHSGYISPEAMVRCLSTLTRLEYLLLGFKSPLSRPVTPVREGRHPHPPTRSTLSTLTDFHFKGVSEYLEDFVAQVNMPLLNCLYITFFHQLIFDTPQLIQFFARTPNIQLPIEPRIIVSNHYIEISSSWTSSKRIMLRINCSQSDWQLSSLAQVYSSSLPEAFFPMVERLYCLYISKGIYSQPYWQGDIENSQWLEVLQPFTALKDLQVSWEFLPRIAPAFQEMAGERVTEVLPALQSISVEELHRHPSGPVQEAVEKFVAARQLAGRPMVALDSTDPFWETREPPEVVYH